MKKNIRNRILISMLMVLFMFCFSAIINPVSAAGTPTVYTTFYPTKYFAERIGGELIQVINPVPSDADAIFWMPDAKAIQNYQKADLIIINGAEFEKWVLKVSLPKKKIVDTAKPLKKDFIYFQEATTHSHGPGSAHSHQGLDGHTWVDPLNAKIQAEVIKDSLVKLMPDKASILNKNFSELINELNELDAAFKKLAEKDKKTPLLTSHPAYNYIAKRYGWNIHNLDLNPEEMPDAKVFDDIKAILKTHPAKFLIWESFPKAEIAKKMKEEYGIESIEFSPCELLDEADIGKGENYFKVMKKNIEELKKIFGN